MRLQVPFSLRHQQQLRDLKTSLNIALFCLLAETTKAVQSQARIVPDSISRDFSLFIASSGAFLANMQNDQNRPSLSNKHFILQLVLPPISYFIVKQLPDSSFKKKWIANIESSTFAFFHFHLGMLLGRTTLLPYSPHSAPFQLPA